MFTSLKVTAIFLDWSVLRSWKGPPMFCWKVLIQIGKKNPLRGDLNWGKFIWIGGGGNLRQMRLHFVPLRNCFFLLNQFEFLFIKYKIGSVCQRLTYSSLLYIHYSGNSFFLKCSFRMVDNAFRNVPLIFFPNRFCTPKTSEHFRLKFPYEWTKLSTSFFKEPKFL